MPNLLATLDCPHGQVRFNRHKLGFYIYRHISSREPCQALNDLHIPYYIAFPGREPPASLADYAAQFRELKMPANRLITLIKSQQP